MNDHSTELPVHLIIGCSQGLGLALTQSLLAQGQKVLGIDLKSIPLSHPNLQFFTGDFAADDFFEQLVTQWDLNSVDKVHLLAATGYYGEFTKQTDSRISHQIKLNFAAPILFLHSLVKNHNQRKPVEVIFIGSVSGFLPARNHEVYGATKAGLHGTVRNLRYELDGLVKVRVYHPGPMKTGFHQMAGFPEEKTKNFMSPQDASRIYQRWLSSSKWCGYPAWYFKALHSLLLLFPKLYGRGSSRNVLSGPHLVTGGSRGLGAALIKELRRDKSSQITNWSRQPSSDSNIDNWLSDLRHSSEILKYGSKLKNFQILIANAGFNRAGRFSDISKTDIKTMISLNFEAVALQLYEFERNREHSGVYVAVSSLSHQTGYPGSAVYASTKDCITHLLRSRRSDCSHQLNLVFPGPLATDMARENSPDPTNAGAQLNPQTAAKRLLHKVRKNQTEIYLSRGQWFIGFLGRLAPSFTERLFKRFLLDKMP